MTTSTTQLPNQISRTNSGFTLIELMVTIAVLAILMSIASPSISNQLANQRAKSTTATLNNALKEAKIESVLRRQNMTVVYNNNGSAEGTIEVTDATPKVIASYQYDAKSTIKPAVNSIVFKPSKTATAVTYTICDSNTAVGPRQIAVSAIGGITNTLQGTCP